jgi:AcrR family transcriptional regulator
VPHPIPVDTPVITTLFIFKVNDVYLQCEQRISLVVTRQAVHCSLMPYPSKTNPQAILAAAIKQLEQDGLDALSMRSLASTLGVAPGAIYRYYADRATLEAAIANEGFRLMYAALKTAANGREPLEALRRAARAYLSFARTRPALYQVIMSTHSPANKIVAENELWEYCVQLVSLVCGRRDAADSAVALWSFLHGFVSIEQAGILGDRKPKEGFEVGLEVMLSGFSNEN